VRLIRRTAAVAALLTYALIVLGTLVRTTDSGLSCPDWPTCYGHWVPLPSDLEAVPNLGYTYGQVMLEWVHRLVAGVILGPLVLFLGALTFRRRRERPALALAGAALVLLLLVQGLLGGVHLGNALLVLTVTLGIYGGAAGWRAPEGGGGRLLPLAVAAWGLAVLAMVSAAVTAKTGSSLACTTWPLCDGALVPDLSDGGVRIHFAHRALAAATGLALLLLFWRSHVVAGLPAGMRRLAALAAALVVLQTGLGGLVVLLEVPVWNAVLHQAVGVLTFATVALLMWRCRPLGGGIGRPLPGGSDGLALRGA
jgi:heme a synthase